MSLLVRARELVKRPVVTLAGEDIAQVKDVVFDSSSGRIVGFTLAGRGPFAGPLKQALAWEAVGAVGKDAVMVADADRLADRDEVASRPEVADRDVLGNDVFTADGTDLGSVVDVIVEVGQVADVVGYEIRTSSAMPPAGRKVFLPLPDTLAVSGEALIVPVEALEFVSDDLSGFGAAVASFRARLQGGGSADAAE